MFTALQNCVFELKSKSTRNEKVKDIYGRFIIIGVMAHFSCQIVLNVCVVTGLIPNTGVTLPFISYGGTAIITSMIEVGLVLNVMHCDRKKKSSGAER